MPQHFSEEERAAIRTSLMDKGREIFIRYGLRKATVDQLARAAGISKGSFYNFFPSKEMLFMEIREEEERLLKTDFLRTAFPEEKVDRASLKRFFLGILGSLELSPFLAILMDSAELEYMLRRVPQEWWEKHEREDARFVHELVTRWQAEGAIRDDIDADLIVGIVIALVGVALLREKIQIPNHEATLDLLTDFIVNGLTTEETQR